jgi:nicotinamide-nucleotide amidase
MAGDDELATRIGELLDGRSVATAESCTGGLVAQALARATGSLEWFRGGVVAYHRGVKFDVLGLTPGPVVTERAAREMAEGVARLLDADVAVSVTGAAGPDPLDGAEPGTVVVGTMVGDRSDARVLHFEGDPAAVCTQACAATLDALVGALEVSGTGSRPR